MSEKEMSQLIMEHPLLHEVSSLDIIKDLAEEVRKLEKQLKRKDAMLKSARISYKRRKYEMEKKGNFVWIPNSKGVSK